MNQKKNDNFILLMSLIGNILCFLPLILSWSLPEVTVSVDKIPFLSAVKSPAFSYALVSGISIAIPVLFDFIGHSMLSPEEFLSYRNSISNLVLLVSFLVPDLLLLFYVVPGNHFILLYVLEIQRMVNSASATFFYLNHFGGPFWCNDNMFILIVSLVIGAIFRLYSLFFTDIYLLICEVISLTALSLGSIVFFRMLLAYIQYLKPIYLAGLLTTDQSCCIVYIISSTTAFCGIWVLIIFYHYPKWYEFNTTMLVLENVIFSWYYLIITVFQGRSAIREASIAKQSLEIKKMFVRYISHEIRTPLNTVKMGLQVLLQELTGEGIEKEKLDIIRDTQLACENAVNILNDLLMFDKLEAGILKLELERFPVWEFLELTLRPFRLQALQKNVNLNIKFPNIDMRNNRGRKLRASVNRNSINNANLSRGPSLRNLTSSRGILLTADRYKLSQVISNITSNAIKFTQEGGSVQVNAYLLTENNVKIEDDNEQQQQQQQQQLAIDRLEHSGDNSVHHSYNPLPMIPAKLRIEVVDSGAGLSEENQKRLFNEIIQFNPGKLQQGGGSGLGLFSIMDAHEGSITVTSQGEGQGCTFSIELNLDSKKFQRNRPSTIVATAAVIAATHRNTIVNVPRTTLGALNTGSKYVTDHLRGISIIGLSSQIVPGNLLLPASQSGGVVEHKQSMELEPRVWARSRGRSLDSHSELESLSVSDCNSMEMRDTGRNDSLKESPLVVLVVDDSKLNRSMMIRLLKNRCGDFFEAGDGKDAVDVIKSSIVTGTPLIDVILMDYVMPNMDGPTAVKCIRELGFKGLVIGLTGNALPEDLNHFKSQGANEVLVKPLDVMLFDSIIARWRKRKKRRSS